MGRAAIIIALLLTGAGPIVATLVPDWVAAQDPVFARRGRPVRLTLCTTDSPGSGFVPLPGPDSAVSRDGRCVSISWSRLSRIVPVDTVAATIAGWATLGLSALAAIAAWTLAALLLAGRATSRALVVATGLVTALAASAGVAFEALVTSDAQGFAHPFEPLLGPWLHAAAAAALLASVLVAGLLVRLDQSSEPAGRERTKGSRKGGVRRLSAKTQSDSARPGARR